VSYVTYRGAYLGCQVPTREFLDSLSWSGAYNTWIKPGQAARNSLAVSITIGSAETCMDLEGIALLLLLAA
jgi:hypothetical protein